ncbi:MAG: hypothetical protein Q7T21_00355 [Gallionella sp.]|nr:hypothetical protein [Gallionella sp.]
MATPNQRCETPGLLLATRGPNDPHPYVVGTQSILRYLDVAQNCARAEMAYRN